MLLQASFIDIHLIHTTKAYYPPRQVSYFLWSSFIRDSSFFVLNWINCFALFLIYNSQIRYFWCSANWGGAISRLNILKNKHISLSVWVSRALRCFMLFSTTSKTFITHSWLFSQTRSWTLNMKFPAHKFVFIEFFDGFIGIILVSDVLETFLKNIKKWGLVYHKSETLQNIAFLHSYVLWKKTSQTRWVLKEKNWEKHNLNIIPIFSGKFPIKSLTIYAWNKLNWKWILLK